MIERKRGGPLFDVVMEGGEKGVGRMKDFEPNGHDY